MSASLQSHRHSPAEAGSSSIHRSQSGPDAVLGGFSFDPSRFPFDFMPTPFENGTSYVNNVARDREHEVQRNSASGAKSHE